MEPPIASDRKSLRVSISSAPATSETRRSSRGLAISRRQSRASSSSLERRVSVNSLKGLPEVVEVKPSPTALRLRSLARAVRASQALGTLSVRMKYAVPVHEFTGDERHMDMMAMLDDTSPLGTAPWARDIKSERVDSLMQQQQETSSSAPLASVKSKARWKNAGRAAVGQNTGNSSSSAGAMGSYSEAAKPSSLLLRRNGNADPRASRSSLKRHESIRGDLNSLLNGPASPHTATSTSSGLTAGAAPRPTAVPENLDARIFCARSLYKLSCQPGSELAIIQGGAVYQIADFSDVEHPKLLRYCAATLANLTTDARVVETFVRNGGAHALLELSWSPCLHVKILCATALCRITQHAPLAQTLVRARGIIELLALLALPHDQLQVLVVSSVLNLVFHGHVFPDRVYLGEPHAAQSQLGIMSVVSQFATSPDMTMFAAEVLFNLSLYPASCTSVLRGGGAETLHALAALVGKAIEETGNASSRFMPATASPVRSTRPSWATNTPAVLRILQRIAETLGNFSAYVEFHGILSTYGMKTLSLLLFGALRDVGSKVYGAAAEVRLQHTVVACSRALANFSSNDDLRKHAFSQEIVHMTTRLTLLDRQRILASQDDARVFFRNIVRTLCNLSFSDTCTAYFMEFPQVLPLLHAIAIAVEERGDPLASEQPVADRTTPSLRVSNLFTGEDVKEDALVTILNLAQQAAYANDLVRILDGKRLALAAADASHSGRLKYIYSLVLCNLLFESRLQQIVYGDLVIHSLVYGFHFFGAIDASDDVSGGSAEQRQYRAMNLAFGDDQERFLAAICIMASEIMDPDNIERIIELILDCLKRPVEAATLATTTSSLSMGALKAKALGRKLPRAAPVRRRQITCFAAAALYTLARSSTQRGDTHNLIHSPAIEDALIGVCERATSASTASGCSSDATAAVSCNSPSYCSTTQAFCAASLYHLCASGHVSRRIIQALIHCCNANEETLSLLACSASFAIISFTPEGRSELVACAHLATALNRLGRTSQPECQQYAAIAACNVSTLQCIWTSTELKDFIVMALLRANSVQAKQIHAKTLSNLLSHLSTREKAVEDGVLYALMKLSQVMLYRSTSAPQSGHSNSASLSASMTTTAVHSDGSDSHSLHDGLKFGLVPPSPSSATPSSTLSSSSVTAASSASSMDEVFSIGLQALFNLSCEHQYHQRLLSNGVMAYLAAPVAGKHASTGASAQVQTALQSSSATDHLLSASSFLFSHTSHHHLTCQLTVESRRYAMGIICNLSSYDANHKELMHAQVSDIIRKYVDSDTETRASAAMALRNLSCKQPWVEMLCERKTLQLVISFTQCDHPVVKQFAVEALANCSLITDSLHLYSELRVARAMLVVLEKVAVSAGSQRRAAKSRSSEAERSGNNDSDDDSARTLEASDDTHDADMETCMAALKCLHNLAFDDALALNLMDENAVLRLLSLLEHRALGADEDACLLTATMVHILSGKPRCAESLLRQRVVSLCALLHRAHAASLAIAFECMGVLLNLSTYQQVQETLAETQVIHVVVSICSSPVVATDVRIRECGAITIRNLTLSVAEHLSLFYGESGLDSDESVLPLSLTEDGRTDLDTSSPGSKSPKKPEHRSADLEPFDNDQDDSSGSSDSASGDVRISRLIERHLLHGVRYFQRELDSLSDAGYDSGSSDAAATPIVSDRILHEACAGIANLSTIRLFRVAMVRLGIVDTLLRVYHYDLQSSPSRHASTSSTLLRRICAATLHRLAVEDEATMDDNGLLVPSLLSILKLTDEELHHVRYECEKVSLYQPNSSMARSRRHARVQSLVGASDEQSGVASTRGSITASHSRASSQIDPKVMNRRGSIMVVGGSAATSLTAALTHVAMAATTHCVKQTYREQKWMLFVLKTTLSSASMIPTLEKKQMKVIGQPRLAHQDATAASLASSASASSSASKYSAALSASESDASASEGAVKPSGGYLLPVHMDKYTVRHDECTGDVQMGPMRFGLGDDSSSGDGADRMHTICLSGSRITVVDTAVHPLVHRDSPDWASLLQTRKFDRHMRSTRRTHRRNPNSSPVLSLFT